ncbi:MAG TPA: NAD(P)/FAD-dependent oxidoreductase, partial [Naasia sp.]
MTDSSGPEDPAGQEALPDLDVLIVGAGISGIGAACYLQSRSPRQRWAILEARDALGGTWDLFRYPGVRSDSDLHTFGYEFRPWTEDRSIATADRILAYLRDTAREHGIEQHIRFGHRVVRVEWSSASALWTVHAEVAGTGRETVLTCRWIFCATGYYRYDAGHSPDFPGRSRFRGPVVHPQLWPADLDCSGKRVVVIGSGATAVTLVPALAASAAHVTMIQRTPTYIVPSPAEDAFAKLA